MAVPGRSPCADLDALGSAYPYLLGVYLGDGMLSPGRRGVWRLRISMDTSYPAVASRVKSAILDVAGRAAGEVVRAGWVEIYGCWKHWACVFPQHGRGPKHTRPIALAEWQQRLVQAFPDEFLAGLIHSDGCRCVNRVKRGEYPRYFFSNRSADIRSLFIATCGLLGVDCRPAGERNVSVARRDAVALLDMYVGPKR